MSVWFREPQWFVKAPIDFERVVLLAFYWKKNVFEKKWKMSLVCFIVKLPFWNDECMMLLRLLLRLSKFILSLEGFLQEIASWCIAAWPELGLLWFRLSVTSLFNCFVSEKNVCVNCWCFEAHAGEYSGHPSCIVLYTAHIRHNYLSRRSWCKSEAYHTALSDCLHNCRSLAVQCRGSSDDDRRVQSSLLLSYISRTFHEQLDTIAWLLLSRTSSTLAPLSLCFYQVCWWRHKGFLWRNRHLFLCEGRLSCKSRNSRAICEAFS